MPKNVDAHILNHPNLPSKLICLLHNVTMHADPVTDEVYAQNDTSANQYIRCFTRSYVQILQTKHKWLQEGLQVQAKEVLAKVVKRSRKLGILQLSESDISEEGDSGATIELYGKWQLEMLQFPHAVNGIVPKNKREQVEVWSEKCLPPGTIHLRFLRIRQVARRLEIDYALAMVGFEFRSGRSFPIFEGIIVYTELKDVIL